VTKPKISIEQQIAEVGRELGIRRGVYPQFIARGRMSKEEADEHITRLEAVYSTLLWLRDNRAWVLAATPESPLPAPTHPA
jgi:hypothetical protein